MQLAALLQHNSIGTPWLVKLDWLMGSRADASRPWNWYSSRLQAVECWGRSAPTPSTRCIGFWGRRGR